MTDTPDTPTPTPDTRNPITKWVDGRIKLAVDAMHADLKGDIADMEIRLTSQITSLPGLLGSQIKNVAIDAEGVAESVAGKLPPLLPPVLQTVLNPADMCTKIAQAVLQGIPDLGIPGIFHLFQKGRG